MRDYLYISLGGNRGGRAKTYRNLMATMTLGGLWHGAAWNFVLWGVYQGAMLSVHRALTGPQTPAPAGLMASLPRALQLIVRLATIAIFFQLVSYGWLLFRAGSLDQILDFTARLATINPGQFGHIVMPPPPMAALLGMAFVLAWDLATELGGGVRFYLRWPMAARGALYAAMIYLLAMGATTAPAAFIYFQF